MNTPSRNRFSPLLVALMLLLSAASTQAAPTPSIERLLSSLARPGANPTLIFALEETQSGRVLLESITGPRPANSPAGQWTRQALSDLQAQGNEGLARALERRLALLENSWVARLEQNPNANYELILRELSDELLRVEFIPGRSTGIGPVRFAADVEAFLKSADGLERSVNELRNAAEQLGDARPELKLGSTLLTYDQLIHRQIDFSFKLTPREVFEVLSNPEAETTILRLRKFLIEYQNLDLRNPTLDTVTKIRASARKTLQGVVAPSDIQVRIDEFLASAQPGAPRSQNALKRLLGEMNVPEVNRLVHGGNPLKPSSESLLGKYIKATGAATQEVEFPIYADDGSSVPGPKRLVVAVSQESLAEFQKLFMREEFMTVTGHAYLTHNGRVNAYNLLDGDFRLAGTEFTPMPWVNLTTTEGQRLTQYLRFFKKYSNPNAGWGDWNQKNLKYTPWSLEGYCATGAFMGCTRWIGDLPIGDARVMEYSFPGAVDASAMGYGAREIDPTPRVQRLAKYEHPDPLVHQVWKVPGNMQFAEAIGLKEENLRANFTNPGWLIATLLGPAPLERVPVVFVVRPDHKLPFPAQWTPHYENRY